MTIEQVVMVAILKQFRQLGYREIHDELSDNISYRRFAKIHEGEVPGKTTLNENIKRISPEGWEEIHQVIVKKAKELGIEKGKRKVVFGHKILLSGGESNLILDCMIERGNWSDAEYFEKGIDRLKERYDIHPESLTTDGGFASKDNYDYAVGKGIKKVL